MRMVGERSFLGSPTNQSIGIDSAARASPTHKKFAGPIFDGLFYAFIIAMIVGATMFAFSDDESKSIFGYRFYSVLSDSMRPEFAKGDMIIIELIDSDYIDVGDIVTFNPGSTTGAYLTHRVVGFADNRAGVAGNYVITKGDTNDVEDPPTPVDNIIGRYLFSVPYAGTLIRFSQDNLIPTVIILVSTFFLILTIQSLAAEEEDDEHQREEGYNTG